MTPCSQGNQGRPLIGHLDPRIDAIAGRAGDALAREARPQGKASHRVGASRPSDGRNRGGIGQQLDQNRLKQATSPAGPEHSTGDEGVDCIRRAAHGSNSEIRSV
jgi:hypothetical protein